MTDCDVQLVDSASALGGVVGPGRERCPFEPFRIEEDEFTEAPSTSAGDVEGTETPTATATEPGAGAGEGCVCATTAEGRRAGRP